MDKSFYKILKGIGKEVGEKATETTSKVVDSTLRGGAKVLGGMFDSVDVNDVSSSAIQRLAGVKMNKKAGRALIGGAIVLGVGNEEIKSSNISKLGSIEAEGMANMVNFTSSPELESTLEMIEGSSKGAKGYANKSLSRNTHGAEGDIVFALHNLRNQD